jgi:hypothetical protein
MVKLCEKLLAGTCIYFLLYQFMFFVLLIDELTDGCT